MTSKIKIGTSGWSYKEWENVFYPDSETPKLTYYGGTFETAEIDSTFYANPASAKAFDGDVEAIAPLLPDYLKRFPASARVRGLSFDSSGNIEDPGKLGEEAKKVVMVKIRILTSKA